MYYIGEYLQSVSGITVQEDQGKLVVQVTSSAREELLRVVCTDPYGNSYTSPVENGKAEFSQITPGTFYTVQVQVNGFHRLTSNISEVYTTAGTTNIAALNAGSGTQDGRVALSMIVDGAEPAKWQVYYSADGEPELTKTFTGHTVTVENLSIGKLYTFRMEILDGINHYPANGQNTVQFVPVQLIAATDLDDTAKFVQKMHVPFQAQQQADTNNRQIRTSNNRFRKHLEPDAPQLPHNRFFHADILPFPPMLQFEIRQYYPHPAVHKPSLHPRFYPLRGCRKFPYGRLLADILCQSYHSGHRFQPDYEKLAE